MPLSKINALRNVLACFLVISLICIPLKLWQRLLPAVFHYAGDCFEHFVDFLQIEAALLKTNLTSRVITYQYLSMCKM